MSKIWKMGLYKESGWGGGGLLLEISEVTLQGPWFPWN